MIQFPPPRLLPALSFAAMVFASTAVALPLHAQTLSAPPAQLAASLQLSPVYVKYIDVGGLPVVASARVSDYAVEEAAYLIRHMVGQRPDILQAIAQQKVRFVVMAPAEMTTDIPEYRDMTPKAYWDHRARGLGATPARPATSAGEENLLNLPGDPYFEENILIHEFSHTVYEMGMVTLDPSFDRRLLAAYEHAREKGLWQHTYAMTNRTEYWASVAQAWFDCARGADGEHNDINTRAKLKVYDPEVSVLLKEAFGDGEWRYIRMAQRPASERTHLAGFDPAKAGQFVWPADNAQGGQGKALAWLPKKAAPKASPSVSNAAGTIFFINHLQSDVSVDWLDFNGHRKHYADLKPGDSYVQNTYAGHVWRVSSAGKLLGLLAAPGEAGYIDISDRPKH
ncbi:hypothetical protein [Undibacterium sp.]|uniref:VHL beta domain-containing protein n=1 Tax=Undibacterium sp. TaxID=1914977 RepID=UPI00374CF691